MKAFTLLCLLSLATAYGQGILSPRSTATVFHSGFEEGNKSIWNDYDSNPDSTNLLMLDPGPFSTPGNHVMRLRVPPGRGGADLVKTLPGSYDKLYLRWYQKWEAGYDFTARNHGSGLYAGPRNLLGRSDIRPSGSDLFCSYFEPADGRMNLYTYYRGMYMDCVNPNGACWGDHFPCWFDEGANFCDKAEHRETIMPPVMESGRWYCFEMMLDAGTPVAADSLADGILNYWIDGMEYGPWQHLWFRTTADLKLNILWLSLFHHSEHSIAGILLDDIVVSTDRVGCGPLQGVVQQQVPHERSLSIYPNPGHTRYTLTLPPKAQHGARIVVLDALGRNVVDEHVQQPKAGSEHHLDLSNFPPGVYMVSVSTKYHRQWARIMHTGSVGFAAY